MLPPVPVTVVTGFLGVGKTTAIRDALANKPPEEPPWAVLVNEFGEIGIDGALLEGGDVSVREIPGGCICCTAGVALKTALIRVLRDVRPGRLLIEPTGLAHPATILDLLRRPGIREAVLPRATITLVDARRLTEPRVLRNPTFQDQVQVADVLVANKADLCEPEDLARFTAFADKLWPAPLVVAQTRHGHLEPAWLDLDPTPAARDYAPTSEDGHDHHHHHEHQTDEALTQGWIWPPDVVFEQLRLNLALRDLVHANPDLMPSGALRIKGLFRTPGAWVSAQANPDAVSFEPVGWRRDSRVEIIALGPEAPDWNRVKAHIESAVF